jgi:alpha-aminoadipic semialdehyde synthase
MKENYDSRTKLQVIGDISVDINGAIEFTKKATTPGNPVFVYNHLSGEIIDGYIGNGIVVMAVDNLPCELPRASSRYFSETLMRFIPSIVKADFSVDFESLALSPEIKKAMILHHGKLTPNYQYINKYL